MMADVEYDKKDQMQRIQAYVVPGEILYAVYDLRGAGTGFVGVTDKRVIFYDQAYLRKKKARVSVPYSHVTAVASEDSGGIVFKSSTLYLLPHNGRWPDLRTGFPLHRESSQLLQGRHESNPTE